MLRSLVGFKIAETSIIIYNIDMESKDFDKEKLKVAIEKRNLSIEDFATQIGITKKSLLAWLRGTTIPYKSKLEKIFKNSNITEEEISKDYSKLGKIGRNVTEINQKEFEETFLPFFELHNMNVMAYTAQKNLNTLKLIDTEFFNGKNITLVNMDKGKFDKPFYAINKEITSIINSMKEVVEKVKPENPQQFIRINNAAKGFLQKAAREMAKENYSSLENDELYFDFSMRVINFINETILESKTLSKWVSDGIIPEDINIDEISLEKRNLVDYNLKVIYYLFFAYPVLRDRVIQEMMKNPKKYLWFTLAYTFTDDDNFFVELSEKAAQNDKSFDEKMTSHYTNFNELSDDEFYNEYAKRITDNLADMLSDKDVHKWLKNDYSRVGLSNEVNRKIKLFLIKLVIYNDIDLREKVVKRCEECLFTLAEKDNLLRLGLSDEKYYDLLEVFSDMANPKILKKIYNM